MPYKKTYRRKTYRKKSGGTSYLNTAGKALATASTALTLARSVKALVNTEFKYGDYTFTNTTMGTGSTVALLTGLNRGTGPASRNGDSIRAKSLHVKAYGVWNSLGAQAQVCKVSCVRFNDMNGSAPVIADYQSDTTQPITFRTVDTSQQYTTLWEKTFILTSQRESYWIDEYVKLDHIIKYLGSTSAAADCGANNYYLIFQSSSASNQPTISFTSRLRFIDN